MVALPAFFYRDQSEGVDVLRGMRSSAERLVQREREVQGDSPKPRQCSEADRRNKRQRIKALVRGVMKSEAGDVR